MSAHTYTEDQLVEQPAIELFAELGWQTASAMEEVFQSPSPPPWRADTLPVKQAVCGERAFAPPPAPDRFANAVSAGPIKGEGIYLGRETPGEVVLVPRLRAALERLNPQLPLEAIASASAAGRRPSGCTSSIGKIRKRTISCL